MLAIVRLAWQEVDDHQWSCSVIFPALTEQRRNRDSIQAITLTLNRQTCSGQRTAYFNIKMSSDFKVLNLRSDCADFLKNPPLVFKVSGKLSVYSKFFPHRFLERP